VIRYRGVEKGLERSDREVKKWFDEDNVLESKTT